MMRLLIAAMLLCASAAAGSSNQALPTPLLKLNVVALDAHGQPVTGLTSADFQLLEDGKRQDIAFLRFTGDRVVLVKPRPGEYSNRAGAAWHATVILIDLLTDRIMSDSVMGREVADYLKSVESSEGLYLYMLTARGELYPIHPLPKPDTELTPSAEPWTRNINSMVQTALKGLVGIKPVDDRDTQHRFDVTTNALRDLGSQMGEISGRKNLVWVTHGLPIIGYSISAQAQVDFTGPLRWFCEELERAQIVVYTVGQSTAGAAAAVGTSSTASLAEFTELTGGRGYVSDNAGGAIQQARTDSRANYEIAYYPSSLNPDGKHHKVRIVCARKDVRLQTEQGFYAVAPLAAPVGLAATTLRSRELPAEIEGAAHSPFDATEIGLRASLSPDPIDKALIEVHIDASDLLQRPTRYPESGKVFVAFVAYDEGLKPLPHPVVVSLTPAQFAAAVPGEIELREVVDVPQGVRKLRVIAFDAALGAAGSVTIPMQH